MRILSFSSSFPSGANPMHGVFVMHRLAAMAARVSALEVVHPVGWFPVFRPFGLPARDERVGGLAVRHEPFLYLPGLLKRFDGRFYARGLWPWVRRSCERRRPDLLDAHFVWPDGVGVAELGRRLGLPYSITLRGTVNPRYRKAAFRERIGSALRGAAAVISVSRPMAEIAAGLGVPRARIHVIPNGVDPHLFSPVPRPQAREAVGLAPEGPLIVAVGNISHPKGHEELIRALGTLPADVHLVVIGTAADSRFRRKLERVAGALGLERRVTFAGRLRQETVAAYFNAADASVLASHSEGCPNVVLESLACGTPVVATAVGAVPEFVTPGANGLLVPPKDPEALATALRTALDSSWSRPEIRRSVAYRTWDAVAEEVLACMEHTLAAGRSHK